MTLGKLTAVRWLDIPYEMERTMYAKQGRNPLALNRLQWTLMSVGMVYVVVGCCLCPDEVRAQAIDWAWGVVEKRLPW